MGHTIHLPLLVTMLVSLGTVPSWGADLIPFGSEWTYLNPIAVENDPGTIDPNFDANWFRPDFDTSGPNPWMGPAIAPFARVNASSGANFIEAFTETDRDFIRPLGTGLELPPRRERLTSYFRHEFVTTESMTDLGLEFLVDDGAVIYLDGVEVARYLCCEDDRGLLLPPDITPAFINEATSLSDEKLYQTAPVLIEELPAGQHVLAVSVHQFGTSSNDMAMSLRLFDGYVFDPLIAARSEWKYFVGEEEPTPDGSLDWATLDFDDSSWDTGRDGFGFDIEILPPNTLLPLVDDDALLSDMQDGLASSLYLRQTFDIEDPSVYTQLEFQMDYDDGAIVYINGQEVVRESVDGEPGVPVPFDAEADSHESTNASGEPPEKYVIDLGEFPDLLNAGQNVIGIHGINESVDSFDFLLAQLSLAALAISGGEELAGDFNGNGELDANDLDLLSEAIRNGSNDVQFDLNGDGPIDDQDRSAWLDEKNTWLGDANLDGEFNSSDMVAIFVAGEFEDNIAGNSSWSTGDWNGDADFTSADIVAAFVGGGFEVGPRAAAATVPEPSSFVALFLGAFALVAFRSAKGTQTIVTTPKTTFSRTCWRSTAGLERGRSGVPQSVCVMTFGNVRGLSCLRVKQT